MSHRIGVLPGQPLPTPAVLPADGLGFVSEPNHRLVSDELAEMIEHVLKADELPVVAEAESSDAIAVIVNLGSPALEGSGRTLISPPVSHRYRLLIEAVQLVVDDKAEVHNVAHPSRDRTKFHTKQV